MENEIIYKCRCCGYVEEGDPKPKNWAVTLPIKLDLNEKAIDSIGSAVWAAWSSSHRDFRSKKATKQIFDRELGYEIDSIKKLIISELKAANDQIDRRIEQGLCDFIGEKSGTDIKEVIFSRMNALQEQINSLRATLKLQSEE